MTAVVEVAAAERARHNDQNAITRRSRNSGSRSRVSNSLRGLVALVELEHAQHIEIQNMKQSRGA